MKFDLAFVLVDLGEPWYKQAASEMIRSARRAYKNHDMRVVQLSDSNTDPHPDADGVFGFKTEVVKETLCQFKGHAIATYALQADRPVIFCDVDLLWQTDGLLERGRSSVEFVACMWREDMPSMPINTGVIFTKGRADFWELYRSICGSLPAEMQAWWGDQVAMTSAWLTEYAAGGSEPALIRLDMDETAPAPNALPSELLLDTPAVHFKGERKHLMIAYARMLDKDAFDFVRPGKVAIDNATKFYANLREANAPKVVQREGWAF